MSTPKTIDTATGVEMSLDGNGEMLQLAVTQNRENGPWWNLTTNLTRDEVVDLRDHLSNWLAGVS